MIDLTSSDVVPDVIEPLVQEIKEEDQDWFNQLFDEVMGKYYLFLNSDFPSKQNVFTYYTVFLGEGVLSPPSAPMPVSPEAAEPNGAHPNDAEPDNAERNGVKFDQIDHPIVQNDTNTDLHQHRPRRVKCPSSLAHRRMFQRPLL